MRTETSAFRTIYRKIWFISRHVRNRQGNSALQSLHNR